jgi:hypothetical protein
MANDTSAEIVTTKEQCRAHAHEEAVDIYFHYIIAH